MKSFERLLEHQLKDDSSVPYPDFDAMWSRIESCGMREECGSRPTELSGIPGKGLRSRKILVACSLTALLAAAPVYAAFHYDWSSLLKFRSGVQSAIAQNLGQSIERSVTKEGVTLTLHTAVVDENRTVILYSLDIGERPSPIFNFNSMKLIDDAGNVIEGRYSDQRWDAANHRFTGYFEADWAPQSDTAHVRFIAEGLQLLAEAEKEIPFDSQNPKKQVFELNQDKLQKIELNSILQNPDKLMISSAVTFQDPAAKQWAYPELVAYKDGTPVKQLPGGAFGTPGENGEYTAVQYFKESDLSASGTTYKLQYMKETDRIQEQWSFPLVLNKKQMESGTIRQTLDLPLGEGEEATTLEQIVITPTQIRLIASHQQRFGAFPFTEYQLEVAGKVINSPTAWFGEEGNPHLSTLRIERPAQLSITKDTPVFLIGKHEVINHDGGDIPTVLTNISEQKQSITTRVGGYPVQWTYYMKDNDLYVETESSDPDFGGINQTYIGKGKERIIGKPLTINFVGDGDNKAVDVYKNFKGTKASVYIFFYSVEDVEKEMRIRLLP
ncbi:DUF4179 domain-containing protein [Paenibacillus terreus]|uniref:DUF4179 domain-containing protein n=1 Tax=Paenibacillus terreus TaxID=1387834 RepID=A0ABV5BFI9_9BACL